MDLLDYNLKTYHYHLPWISLNRLSLALEKDMLFIRSMLTLFPKPKILSHHFHFFIFKLYIFGCNQKKKRHNKNLKFTHTIAKRINKILTKQKKTQYNI